MSAARDLSLPTNGSPINRKLVLQLNISFLAVFLGYLALFASIFSAEDKPLLILIVATAALNAGAIIGFLYSTFGEEDKKFSQIFIAINGLLGGATLTDLLRKDQSLIIKCLNHIAIGCGLDEKYAGVVLMVIITCVPVGFFWLYFNRKLILNPEIDSASKRLQEANDVLNKKPLQVADPEMETPKPDPEVKAAAKVITESADAIKSNSVGTLVNLGRSFYELQKYDQAIPAFQKALEIRPNQPETLLATASAMVNAGKYSEATPVLEKLTSLSIVPTKAWKLLGYVYLFYPDAKPDKREKLEKSIAASKKFIAFDPEDYGAKLNLACAYGQLGTDYLNAIESVISLVKEIISAVPYMKMSIRDLTAKGEDFEKWTGVKEFMQLLN